MASNTGTRDHLRGLVVWFLSLCPTATTGFPPSIPLHDLRFLFHLPPKHYQSPLRAWVRSLFLLFLSTWVHVPSVIFLAHSPLNTMQCWTSDCCYFFNEFSGKSEQHYAHDLVILQVHIFTHSPIQSIVKDIKIALKRTLGARAQKKNFPVTASTCNIPRHCSELDRISSTTSFDVMHHINQHFPWEYLDGIW